MNNIQGYLDAKWYYCNDRYHFQNDNGLDDSFRVHSWFGSYFYDTEKMVIDGVTMYVNRESLRKCRQRNLNTHHIGIRNLLQMSVKRTESSTNANAALALSNHSTSSTQFQIELTAFEKLVTESIVIKHSEPIGKSEEKSKKDRSALPEVPPPSPEQAEKTITLASLDKLIEENLDAPLSVLKVKFLDHLKSLDEEKLKDLATNIYDRIVHGPEITSGKISEENMFLLEMILSSLGTEPKNNTDFQRALFFSVNIKLAEGRFPGIFTQGFLYTKQKPQ